MKFIRDISFRAADNDALGIEPWIYPGHGVGGTIPNTGMWFCKFDVTFEAAYVDFTTNGGLSFPPDLFSFQNDAFDQQNIGPRKNTVASGDQNHYRWEVTLGAGAAGRFGPTISGGTLYTVEMKVEPLQTTARINGTEYGPFATDPATDWWFDVGLNFNQFLFGAYGVGGSAFHGYVLDNLFVGVTDWGSSEIFSYDFSADIVPPFTAETDLSTPAGLSIVSGQLKVNLPGGGNSDEAHADYAWVL